MGNSVMLEIRLVKQAEAIERLLDLFRISFGYSISAELWNWKYIDNPFASPDPEVTVAMDNGKLVGARPFLFVEMWLGNEKVRAAQHTDTMVHPEYRTRGIFNRMGQFAIQHLAENGYALSYGFPGPIARPGFLKQGWRIVAPTETLLRLIHPQKVISHTLKSKLLGNGLGFFYDKLYVTKTVGTSELSSSFKIEVLDQFTDELEEIDTLRNESFIDLARSEDFLRWRFDHHPIHTYKYIVVKRRDDLWGYAAVSVQKEADSLAIGYIVDYVVKNSDITCFQILINGCLNKLQQSGCDIVCIWAFSEPKLRQKLLTQLGFKSSSNFPYTRFVSYGFLDAIQIQEGGSVNIYDKENWRVTYAYTDTR